MTPQGFHSQHSCEYEREQSLRRDAILAEARRESEANAARKQALKQQLSGEFRNEHSYLTSRYELRRDNLDVRKQDCISVAIAENNRYDDVVDSIERRFNRDSRGGTTKREDRALREADNKRQAALKCGQDMELERLDIQSALDDPGRLLAEAKQLRQERGPLRPKVFQQELAQLQRERRQQSLGRIAKIEEAGRKAQATEESAKISAGHKCQEDYARGLQDLLTGLQQVAAQLEQPAQIQYEVFTAQIDRFHRQLDDFRSRYIRLIDVDERKTLAATLFEASDLLVASAGAWRREMAADHRASLWTQPRDQRAVVARRERDDAGTERAKQWHSAQRLIPEAALLAMSTTGPSISRLITLEFEDADVINLLRILSAESGRTIVAGDDVKGKLSVSLRNVTWEQALDTILEIKGLQKIDKGGMIRIVSAELLTKEVDAKVKAEGIKREADANARGKEADARKKEIQAQTAEAAEANRKLQAEQAAKKR